MDPVWVILVALPLLFLWIVGAVDVLRRRDMSAPAKTFWILAHVGRADPRPHRLLLCQAARRIGAHSSDEAAGQEGSRSVASELEALEAKRESGAISEEDFQAEKYRVLGFDRS